MAYLKKDIDEFNMDTKDIIPTKFKYIDKDRIWHITNLRNDIPNDTTIIYVSTEDVNGNYDLIKYE